MAPNPSDSVSRSRASKDKIRSLADEMLRASLTRSTPGSSPSPSDPPLSAPKHPDSLSSDSVSRSRNSRGELRSLADEMLQASLTRSIPPSYRSKAPASPSSSRAPVSAESLSRLQKSGSASTSASASISRSGITEDAGSITLTGSRFRDAKAKGTSPSLSLSAADAKARVRELYRAIDQAKASVPSRPTGGTFRATCSSDILFLIDTTYSMDPYLDAAKAQVDSIVSDIKRTFLNEADVRVAIVSYKDHGDRPNVEFLDFTSSTAEISRFLARLRVSGGADLPEDVLGGIQQALNASWKQKTRCIIHIGDAPPHGAGILHDLDYRDDYSVAGSEPHGLTHGPLLRRLIDFNINYALLHINASTDRMALAFAQVYAACSADVKLLQSNAYASQVNCTRSTDSIGIWKRSKTKQVRLRFEEVELGTTYSQLRHLVVSTVTTSVSRTTGSESLSLVKVPNFSAAESKNNVASDLFAIREDEGSSRKSSTSSSSSSKDFPLEKEPPQWGAREWFDCTLAVEGFCPDLVVQSVDSLNEMMHADENIKLGVIQLTIHARSKPFGQGSVRLASYACTGNSTGKFVVKSFKKDNKGRADVAEDMRIQALCKAFALEFNGLLKIEPPIDFVMTTCLQSKENCGTNDGCLSLEPFIDGEYIKYNNNQLFVKEDSPDRPDTFNQIAQAFSHFTFERSWGSFLVNDLQGVGRLLTDPSIQTKDPERFTLADTNLNEDGFKFFFTVHKCNEFCHRLELKSNAEMIVSGKYEFRERWPAIEPTVCCSNKLCREIIRLENTHEAALFPGHRWCVACYAQLQSSIVQNYCMGPGPNHEFDTSKLFYESQGQIAPLNCPDHVEKDKTLSSAAAVGGTLWDRVKAEGSKRSISGRGSLMKR